MKDSSGKHHHHHHHHGCPWITKSWSDKLKAIFCFHVSFITISKCRRIDAKLEKKMVEAHQQRKASSTVNSSFKSMNSLILKFPHIRQGLKQVRHLFIQYDEDSNGAIDMNELKRCLNNLQIHLEDGELDDVFSSCDMDGINKGIELKEFIAVLCLIYILKSKLGFAEIESTFEIIVEAFLFLDKNGDGKLNKKDMIMALNEDCRWERSPMHVIMNRFKEMDWADRDGNVSFREFLFSFINWVGIDSHEEEEEEENATTIHINIVDCGLM